MNCMGNYSFCVASSRRQVFMAFVKRLLEVFFSNFTMNLLLQFISYAWIFFCSIQ